MAAGLQTEQDGVSVTYTYEDARGCCRLVVTPRRLSLDERTLPWALVRSIARVDAAHGGGGTVVLDTEEGPWQIAVAVSVDVARSLEDALLDARARSRSRSPMSARRVLGSISRVRPEADDGWHAPRNNTPPSRRVPPPLAGRGGGRTASSLTVSGDVDAEIFEVKPPPTPARHAAPLVLGVASAVVLLGALVGLGIAARSPSSSVLELGVGAAAVAILLLLLAVVLTLVRAATSARGGRSQRLVARRAGLEVGGRRLPWDAVHSITVSLDDLDASCTGRVEADLRDGERLDLTGPMGGEEAGWLCARLLELRADALDGDVRAEDLHALEALMDGSG